MPIVMNQSGNGLEQEVVLTEEYGDEVMCAGWNPQLALVGERTLAKSDRHTEIAAEMASIDVEDFLEKMYRYQC